MKALETQSDKKIVQKAADVAMLCGVVGLFVGSVVMTAGALTAGAELSSFLSSVGRSINCASFCVALGGTTVSYVSEKIASLREHSR